MGVDGHTVGTTKLGQNHSATSMNSPVIILDKLIEAANALSKLPGHSVDFLTSALDHTYGQPGPDGAGSNNPLMKIISSLRHQKLVEFTGGSVPPLGIRTTAVPVSPHTLTLTQTTPTPAVVTNTPIPPVVTSSVYHDTLRQPYDVNALMVTMSNKFQGIPDTVLRSLVVNLLQQLESHGNTLSQDITHLDPQKVSELNYLQNMPPMSKAAVTCAVPGCIGQEPLTITTSPSPFVTHDLNPQDSHMMAKPHSNEEKPTGIHYQLVVTPTTTKSSPLTNIPIIPTPFNPPKLPPNTTPQPTYLSHRTLQPHISLLQPHPTLQAHIRPSPPHTTLHSIIPPSMPHKTLQPQIAPSMPHPTLQPDIPSAIPNPTLKPTITPTTTSTYPYIPTFPFTTSSLLSDKYVTMNLHFKGVSPPETTSFPIMPLRSPFTSATDRAAILSFLLSVNSRGDQLNPKSVNVEPKAAPNQQKPFMDHPKSVMGQPMPVMDHPKSV
ncbi:unnamed protein product, partial [Lymnaea stagnalis]